MASKYFSSLPNVDLISPLDYPEFVSLMNRSYLIITDSGGIQEEAPSLGVPVIVTRNTTERPEAVDSGTVILVGNDIIKIENAVSKLIEDKNYYETFQNKSNPYGDGYASQKILEHIQAFI